MSNTVGTIDELEKIKQWLLKEIEFGEIVDKMTMYQPTVQLRISLSLDNHNIPKEIIETIENKLCSQGE